MRYELSFANGKMVFDWELMTVEIEAKLGRKVGDEEWGPVQGTYPFEEVPLFTSFFVTGTSALLGLEVEVRGKMVISSEGFVLEIYKMREPQKNKVAFLLAYDTKNKTSSAFVFNKANLYAFLQMIKERDKVVPVRESVWEKRDGELFVNRLPVPFQPRKALEWILLDGIREGRYPRINLTWEEGVIRIGGRRLSLFRRNGQQEVSHLSLSLKDPVDVMRILSCL